MKERPILFSGPMVRAILEDRKTQTRRELKPRPPSGIPDGVYCDPYNGNFEHFTFWTKDNKMCLGLTGNAKIKGQKTCHWKCPYGVPGERLWVRETFSLECDREYVGQSKLPTDRPVQTIDIPNYEFYHIWPHYRSTDPYPDLCCEEDSCRQCKKNGSGPHWKPSIHMPRWASRITLEIVSVRVERLNDISMEDCRSEGADPIMEFTQFQNLWESINGPGAWEKNPFVWVVEFKRVS